METFIKKRQSVVIIILSAILLMSLFFYFEDFETVGIVVACICSCIIVLGILFYNVKWYYLITIALIPISIDTIVLGGAKINLPAEGLIALVIPVTLLFSSWDKQKFIRVLKHPLTILLMIDVLVQFVSALLGTHLDVSLKRLAIRVVFIIGFYFFISLLNSKKDVLKILLAYSIGLIPVMFFTLKNHFGYSFDPKVVFSICQPFFNDHTIYGACLAFVIPLFVILVKNRKVFGIKKTHITYLIILGIFIIISEVLALSRASILSLAVALMFYVGMYFRMKFSHLIIGFVVVVSVLFVFKNDIYSSIERNESVSNDGEIVNHFSSVTNVQSDASNLERINRWVCAYRMFEEKPFLGYGPGTYQFEYNQFQTLDNKTYISTNRGDRGNAHSEYLTYLSETGIFGFIVFVLTVFVSIYYGMKNYYQLKNQYLKALNLAVLLGLVTFYFHGLFNSFIDQGKMAFLYFGGLAVIVFINLNFVNTKTESE